MGMGWGGGFPLTSAELWNTMTVVANVAQLVEQLFRKQQVMGSSPIVGSTFQSRIRRYGFLCFSPQNSQTVAKVFQ
jgi:flavoprotein